uniref:Unknown protein 6 (Fragments) n=1 Tax=Lonomia obliqua TaxID=304329 RepID=UP06_LONON|nr:RecName: Full=Unknown protein 6 [Lonomia obliqua]
DQAAGVAAIIEIDNIFSESEVISK